MASRYKFRDKIKDVNDNDRIIEKVQTTQVKTSISLNMLLNELTMCDQQIEIATKRKKEINAEIKEIKSELGIKEANNE